MPALPTLTVTQAQADRMLAAFGDVPTYKEWLRFAIVDYVVEAESRAMDAMANTSKKNALATLTASLPTTAV